MGARRHHLVESHRGRLCRRLEGAMRSCFKRGERTASTREVNTNGSSTGLQGWLPAGPLVYQVKGFAAGEPLEGISVLSRGTLPELIIRRADCRVPSEAAQRQP